MKHFRAVCLLLLALLPLNASAQQNCDFSSLDEYFPLRSFYISLPPASYADDFIDFVANDLIPGGFNNLVVRVNWSFPFKSHPELIDWGAWDMEHIQKLVAVCREGNVRLVPMINLLGHQSWQDRPQKLLQVYPEFDERPEVALPAKGEWKWPNPDGYYCKSYCPNHPDVHRILFECIDEMIDAFGTTDFHCGMDEVFDLASDNCPRCKGMSKAQVFADEVNRINAHLREKGVTMWMWADRLLDGSDDACGYGEWSASMNDTHAAIDMIDRDVIMCDWHYRVAEQSAVLFALKGFRVITCGWTHPPITSRQMEDLLRFRTHSSSPSDKRYLGFMQTVWSGYPAFKADYEKNSDEDSAARNYRHLKGLFIQYADQLRDKPFPKKDGRHIRGL